MNKEEEKEKKKKPITGYLKANKIANSVFNISFAIILILLSLPLLLILSLIIKIRNGGSVLYKGVRLGINKKPFIMYKFRTLPEGSAKKIGAEILTDIIATRTQIKTPLGRLIRDTRLDELPQLFNVLKGDMDFLGPRPERPEIYEKLCKNIKGYDKRFSVKPGLIGYSQLFTPHSSPKEIRAHIDNIFMMKKHNFAWDLGIILYTIVVVLVKIVYLGSRFIWKNLILAKVLGLYNEKRKLERVRPENARIYIGQKTDGEDIFTHEAKLIDINEEAMLVYDKKIDYNILNIKMETVFRYRTRHCTNKRPKKVAMCYGTIYRKYKLDRTDYEYGYVIKYTPISRFHCYMVHQYFLDESVVY